MTVINLFPDQAQLKSGIYRSWDSGAKNVLGVLPTGGGKSVIVSDIVLDGYHDQMMQAIIAHRNELVAQMSMHVAERGITHRIIGPDAMIAQITRQHREVFNGQSFVNLSARTSVIGVDTLISRKDMLGTWAAQHDRWIIDEGHHVLRENKWGKAVLMFPRAHGLAVTATAIRADGLGLGREYDGVYDDMIVGPSMRELIDAGRLADYEIVCPPSDLVISDEDIGASGEFKPAATKAASQRSHIVGDVVENYCRYAFGKRGIVFATDVETAGKIAANFNAFGIRAAALSADTPSTVRDKYVKEFKSGKLTILVNVDLFGEGFDCPACEVVIMARPTASLGLYLQMVGRALRTAKGKLYGLLIDHVGNVKRHGFPDKARVWSLARRDKRGKQEKDPDDMPLTTCTGTIEIPGCNRPYERFLPRCPHCGLAPPLPTPRERTIEMVDGDLILLDRATLEKMRTATMMESAADIGQRIADGAGGIRAARYHIERHLEKIAAQQRLTDAIAQWGAIERHRGRDDRESYRRFYITTGIDILGALDASRSRQDFETLAATVESWYSQ